jgi:triosephosphate isomerase (TIM)
MSRKLYIAGNWKMNLNAAGCVSLAGGLAKAVGAVEAVDVGVAPPFVYLQAVGKALAGSRIGMLAQNMCCESDGAFTGDISSTMLKDVCVQGVILGHSERRHVFGESDELINRKVVKALADGLKAILCVGELLEERQTERTQEVVAQQVKVGLEGITKADMASVTIAYEPVWAIGTGVTATPEQAQEVHEMIRGLLSEKYGQQIADATGIQYGGSVKGANAAELLGQKDIDGALVGGASLKLDEFTKIVRAGAELKK